MPVSIRDVAAKANVSVGTVSKVLNNAPSRISPTTRDHIRLVAESLGYQPNRIARSLGRRRTDTIGLMISGLLNPFFVNLAETAERLLLDAGYQVYLDAAPSHHETHQRHVKLRGWPVDGILVWAGSEQNIAEFLGSVDPELPIVYLGSRRLKFPNDDVVAYNLYDGGQQAARHLIERGYGRRRGLMMVTPSPEPTQENAPHDRTSLRERGFWDACRQASIPVEFVILPGSEDTREGGYHVGEQIAARPLSQRPDAIFCHNDTIAIGLHRALRRAGLRIPEDIGIVGVDHTDESRYLEVPLTTIATPAEPMCRVAVDILIRRLNEGNTKERGEQILLPVSLVEGGTT